MIKKQTDGARRFYLVIAIGLCLYAVIGAELFCRYYLGLGTPPLSIPDSKIEYLFAPDQDLYRFGNHIIYNHWSMRNEPISETAAAGQTRIMVVGDSVPNGGSLTDHSRLATTMLSDDKTLYMNVSAGSWGPANELAYLRKFGFFDAKELIVVLSGHDVSDVPTFTPLDPEVLPQSRPWLALDEAIIRYLPRYLPWKTAHASILDTAPKHEVDLSPLVDMIELAKHNGVAVCVVLHHTRSDRLAGIEHEGLVTMRAVAQNEQATIIDDKVYLDPKTSYRDDIHINDKGQADLVPAFKACRG